MCVCCMSGWIWQQKKEKRVASTYSLSQSLFSLPSLTRTHGMKQVFVKIPYAGALHMIISNFGSFNFFSACRQMLCPKQILLIRWKISQATSFDRFPTLHTNTHTISYLTFSLSPSFILALAITHIHSFWYQVTLRPSLDLNRMFVFTIRHISSFFHSLVGFFFLSSNFFFFISFQARLSQFVSSTHHSSQFPTLPRCFTRFE